MPDLAYLASPYSHGSPRYREWRFKKACEAVAHLLGRGILVVSPIAHSHPVATLAQCPPGFEYWKLLDFELLARCNRVIVLKLPGWDVSVGVAAEIAEAARLGIPVEYMEAINHG